MAIGTTDKDIPEMGGGVQKTISPGNRVVKINDIKLVPSKMKTKSGAMDLVMNIETAPLGDDFEGFWINKDDQSLGRHAGQVGRLKAGQFPFSDAELTNKVKISRDMEILKFIKALCTETEGGTKWLEEQNNKHETIEELVTQFNTDAPFKGQFYRTCIAGSEYMSGKDKTYLSYDLYLPKFTKAEVPLESEKVPEASSKVYKFNEKVHIRKNTRTVSTFKDTSDDLGGGNDIKTSFSLEDGEKDDPF